MKTRIKLTFSLVSAILAMFAVVCMGCPDNGTESTHTHEWGDWTVITPATCTTAGEETRGCALDATHTETRPIDIDPNAHDWGDWEVTIPATVEADGVETATCKHNPEHTQTRAIPKIPLFTSVAALGTWLASQPENTAETAYTVKLNTNNISTIRTTLNNAANKYVNLDLSGSTITTISDNLFCGPSNVTSGFGCATLTGIILPNSVTSIGSIAFYNCNNLTSITIPKSVTDIGSVAFGACTSLIEINVDAGNSAYSADNGVLYNKNKTTLVAYPSATGAFTIPNSVTRIEDCAFYDSLNLASITIPDSVTSIGNVAFYYCVSLTSVTFEGIIPSSGFNADAFGNSTDQYNIGDLRAKYLASGGGKGTYTRPSGESRTWTKQ
jgi:hypothetical protein